MLNYNLRQEIFKTTKIPSTQFFFFKKKISLLPSSTDQVSHLEAFKDEILLFFKCVEGVRIIGRDELINLSLSRPMLRASRIQWDLCKVDHYECYHQLDWEVQWKKEGFQHNEGKKC